MDNKRKQVEVVINGRIYKLGTTDSEEYIKSIAGYVDRKYREIVEKTDSITRVSEYFPIMLALNITDDLFKKSQETGRNLKNSEELAGRIQALENQVKDAGKTIRLKDGRINELETAAARVAELETALEEKNSELDRYADMGAELEKAKAALEEAKSELEKTKSESEEVKAALEEAKAEPEKARTELEEKEKEIVSLKSQLEESSYNLNAKDEELAGIRAQLESEKENSDKEAVMKELDEAYAALDEKTKEFEDVMGRKRAVEAALQTMRITLQEKEESEAILKKELEAARLADENSSLEAEKLKAENKRLSDMAADAGLLSETDDKKGKSKDKYKDRDSLLKELNDIKSEYGRLKKTNSQLNEKIKKLEGGL